MNASLGDECVDVCKGVGPMTQSRGRVLSRHSSPERYVGQWVQVKGAEDLGFARCLEKTSQGAVVAYHDIPGVVDERRVVPIEDLALIEFSPGTRVWLQSVHYGWHAAEVGGFAGFGEYRVRIAGMHDDVKIRAEKLMVRWNKPLSDPEVALAHGLCDSPEYYDARAPFISELVRQRGSSRGFTAALSAPVDLYAHQLDTVARVLADPVLRFLLADEVGLGKTVEAGLILRQLLLDDDRATGLVCVPSALVGQWDEELRDRLLLGDAIEQRRVAIISHEQLRTRSDLRSRSLVVIDEAHALLSHLDAAPARRADLINTRGLLLLSATPMRRDFKTFLSLLNLVDPMAFPLAELASFEARVQARESSATNVSVLTSRRASVRQRTLALDGLRFLHGQDPNFQRLATECLKAADGNEDERASWRDLAEYVRETYRISRRMIRHRRSWGATSAYPVAGRRAAFVTIEDSARPVVDAFLDRYRELLADDGRVGEDWAYARIVMHALGGPLALGRHLEDRLRRPRGQSGWVVDQDRFLFENIVARLALIDTDRRFAGAAEVIEQRLDRDQKVLVVATSTAVAREFRDEAVKRWGPAVHEHLNHQDQQARDENTLDFLESQSGAILIGDHSIEEGRNLQGADVLVNLDLPLDFNRLEQRIGRLDRFAQRDDPAEVLCISEPSSEWVSQHLNLLTTGLDIFGSSVATLQRKLNELFDSVTGALLAEGARAFAPDLARLREELEEEREEVDLLEEMEAVAVASDFDDASVAEFRAVESDARPLREAFTRLTSVRGGIWLRPVENPKNSLVKFDRPKRSLGQEKVQRIAGLSEDGARQVAPLLERPRIYDRATAVARRGVPLLRLGDPLVDWLDQNLRSDERGRTRALIRRTVHVDHPGLWLAADFQIEFDESHLEGHDLATRRRLRRRGDAVLPPAIVRIWTGPDGVADPFLVATELEQPFDETADVVLRGKAWRDVLDALPDWTTLCRTGFDDARRELRTMAVLAEAPLTAAGRAEREMDSRLAILRARSQRLPTRAERLAAEQDMQSEQSIGEALIRGVREPMVSTIACGAVVLWPAR
ncbi:protein DpdE [Actinokineospora spheciospongiae]|uniref:protein DpdE n=1 Tax=Actinokineospora spheciospongiae TaxID=909613 RepID=UPI0005539C64|nr:protein DpdE [Actinokineospora spheciospongiae]